MFSANRNAIFAIAHDMNEGNSGSGQWHKGVYRISLKGQGLGDGRGGFEETRIAGHLIQRHEFGAERCGFVRLQAPLAGAHVAVIGSAMEVGVVWVGEIRPGISWSRKSMG